MPSCLGICIEKNLIKYAKLTKDKQTSLTNLSSFGIKFYDSLATTVAEIVAETQSENDPICVGLNTEDYTSVSVFSRLSAKDMKSLVYTNFVSHCEENNVNNQALDMRYKLVKNTGDVDSYKAICIAANKTELTNLGQVFEKYKLIGISSVGLSASSLLTGGGVSEKAAVINIEDDTKITVFANGEIVDLISIPIGMDEVFVRLADKYNSYARAYDACKGVNAYAESDMSLDTESKDINDILMPVLYDLKQRIVSALYDYKDTIKAIYITGTGVIVNNIDLYFQDVFSNVKCEVLVPYFINRNRTNLKDVVEVNNALALANYGLEGVDKETDFFAGGGYLKNETNRKKLQKQVTMRDILAGFSGIMETLDNKMKRKVKSSDRRKSVAFDNEVEQLDQLGGAGETSAAGEEEEQLYDPVEEWLVRVTISSLAAFVAYAGVSHWTGSLLDEKIALTNKRISETNAEIKDVQTDKNYIITQSSEYKTKTDKLQQILDSIKTKDNRSFDIPNLLSRLMFSIPAEVKVTSVKVEPSNRVTLSAESGRYAQLGYFVSRLKLEGVLDNVSMQVVSMDASSIKININGVLP